MQFFSCTFQNKFVPLHRKLVITGLQTYYYKRLLYLRILSNLDTLK